MIEPANKPPKRILMVDDSKSARFALGAMLQRHGFAVDSAESAEAALEKIRQAPPDAIFMDHMMPGMDGHEATRLLKADPATKHIPVVMCTSNDQPEHLEKARALGALGILPKPATAEKIREILDVLDREMGAPAPLEREPAPAAPAAAQPQDLQAALRALLPQLVEETLTPLVERIVSDRWQTAERERLSRNSAHIDATVAKALEARASTWMKDLADTVERQIVAESTSAEQRLARTLYERLGDLASRNQLELDRRIMTDERLQQSISAVAATSAEQKATEIVHEQAQKVAQDTTTALVRPLIAEALAGTEQRLSALGRRISWFAAGAGLVGVVSAVVAYLVSHQA